MWLKVGESNNDPKIVASYFLDCLAENNLLPRSIRTDRGSENSTIAGMQRYFCRNQDRSANSFIFGSSMSNQRIEYWWSFLCKNLLNWWINYFKDLTEQNIFDNSLPHHVESIRFCFSEILQRELDEVRVLWNNHYMRKNRRAECPNGRTDILFHTPECYGYRDFTYPSN